MNDGQAGNRSQAAATPDAGTPAAPAPRHQHLPLLRAVGGTLASHARAIAREIRLTAADLATELNHPALRDDELAHAARLEEAADCVDAAARGAERQDLFERRPTIFDRARNAILRHRNGAGEEAAQQRQEAAEESGERRQEMVDEAGEQRLLRRLRHAVHRVIVAITGLPTRLAERLDPDYRVRRRLRPGNLEAAHRQAAKLAHEFYENMSAADPRDLELMLANTSLNSAHEYHRIAMRGKEGSREAFAYEMLHLRDAMAVALQGFPGTPHMYRRTAKQIEGAVRAALIDCTYSPDAATAQDARFRLGAHFAGIGRYSLAQRALRAWQADGVGDVLEVATTGEPPRQELGKVDARNIASLQELVQRKVLDGRLRRGYRDMDAEATRRFVTNRSKRLGARAAAAVYGEYAHRMESQGVDTTWTSLAYQRKATYLLEAAQAEDRAHNRRGALTAVRQANITAGHAAHSADPEVRLAVAYRGAQAELYLARWSARPSQQQQHLRSAELIAEQLQPVTIKGGLAAVLVTPENLQVLNSQLAATARRLHVVPLQQGRMQQQQAAQPDTQRAVA